MDEKNSKKNIKKSYDYLSHAATLGDCTGLIPVLAASEAERESYEAIHHFLPPFMEFTDEDNESNSPQ